jgi:hypothetical protein
MPQAAAQDQWEDVNPQVRAAAPPPVGTIADFAKDIVKSKVASAAGPLGEAYESHREDAAAAKNKQDEWQDVAPPPPPPAVKEKPGFGADVVDILKGQAAGAVGPLGDAYKGYEEGGVLEGLKRGAVSLGRKVIDPTGIIQGGADAVTGFKERQKTDINNPAFKASPRILSGAYDALAPTIAPAVGVDFPGMEQAAKEGDTNRVLAGAAVPIGETIAAGAAARVVPKVPGAIEAVSDAAGRALRVEPTVENTNPNTGTIGRAKSVNTLKPWVKGVANVGKIVGGPQVANMIIPDHPTEIGPFRRLSSGPIPKTLEPPQPGIGAPLPDAGEFYGQRGEDLMARGKAQDALDRQAARTAASKPKSKISVVSPGSNGDADPTAPVKLGMKDLRPQIEKGAGYDRNAPIYKRPQGTVGAQTVGEEPNTNLEAPKIETPSRSETMTENFKNRVPGSNPVEKNVTLAEQPASPERTPAQVKDESVHPMDRQFIHVNGARALEAIADKPELRDPMMDLEGEQLREVLRKSGEDMTNIQSVGKSAGKAARGGSIVDPNNIGRNEAFDILFDKGYTPEQILKEAPPRGKPALPRTPFGPERGGNAEPVTLGSNQPDPLFAERRLAQLNEAASGKGNYNGAERRQAQNFLEKTGQGEPVTLGEEPKDELFGPKKPKKAKP